MKTIYALVDTHLILKLSELPTAIIEELKAMFTRTNPVFFKKKNMGFYVGDTPTHIHSWKQQGTFIVLPRGSIIDIEKVLNRAGLTVYPTIDKTISFDPIEYTIQPGLKMRPYQQDAVDALVEAKCGIVRGPCGCGKSSVCIGTIKELGQPTIVIVHSKLLQDQWVSFISQWFGIVPGMLGGGKKARVSDQITIATQQTLWRMAEKCDPVFKKFGLVVGDECFEGSSRVLMANGTLRDIDSIEVGEQVAFGGLVKHKFARKYEGWVCIFGEGKCVTVGHKFATQDGWVEASNLTSDHYFYYDPKHVFRCQSDEKCWYTPDRVDPLPGGVTFVKGNANLKRNATGNTVFTFYSGLVHNIETENGAYVCEGVLVKNCHRWGSRTFKIVADSFSSRYKIGCSADERRKDGLEFLIHETFGETVKKITREELIDLGKLLPTRIELVRTDYEDEYYLDSIRCGDKIDWVHMITRMTEDEARNEIILHNILRVLNDNSDNKILLLNERTEACRKWVDTLNRLGISAGLMIGGTPNKSDLNSSIAGLHNGSISVGVGTTVADEGMDIPSLTHTFVSCPVHTHMKRLTQMIGRSARVCGDKKNAVCVYFWDRKMFPPMLDDSNPTKRSSDEDRFITKFKSVAEEIVIL